MSELLLECPSRSINILLVDDDDGDVILTTKALHKGRFANTITVVSDGVEALEFLRREGAFFDVQRPDLVLMDLNMPRKDGRETIEEMKQDPELRDIPVVVLTTSDMDQQIVRDLGVEARFYVTKPVDMNKFTSVVLSLPEFGFYLLKSEE